MDFFARDMDGCVDVDEGVGHWGWRPRVLRVDGGVAVVDDWGLQRAH